MLAFANCEGGKIYVGVRDDGTVIGLENPDGSALQIDGDRFEEMRSLEQNLTFEETRKEFAKRDIDFGIQQMKSLKIVNSEDIYTNLGLLLSIKILV